MKNFLRVYFTLLCVTVYAMEKDISVNTPRQDLLIITTPLLQLSQKKDPLFWATCNLTKNKVISGTWSLTALVWDELPSTGGSNS
ncbi:hypothetical protein H0X06_02315 [Candidatus Dependentiae bacterium]|nr:hypothetical protein [Candidatus Dependentiae bacterium]